MNFRTLVNPLRHSDHKVLGVTYLVLEALDFYGFMFCERRYSADFLWFMAMKVCGCLVTASALRNFGHLAKSDVNKGMFAESRTFSYGFLVENFWFQVVIALQHGAFLPCFEGSAAEHPTSSRGAAAKLAYFSFAMFWFMSRATFPKTSYADWEAGNEAANGCKLSAWRVAWINLQVKVVRLNYVFKSQVAVPYFVSLHMRGLLPPEWRFVPLFVSLDIAHNVTTAFFLQTLKFHGFISATTFSFAFNATAYAANAVVAYYFLHAKVDLVALLPNLALSVVNLAFVYRKRGDPRFVQFICFVLGFALQLTALPPHHAAAVVGALGLAATVLGQHAQRITQWGARFTHAAGDVSHIALIVGGGFVVAALLHPLLSWHIGRLMQYERRGAARREQDAAARRKEEGRRGAGEGEAVAKSPRVVVLTSAGKGLKAKAEGKDPREDEDALSEAATASGLSRTPSMGDVLLANQQQAVLPDTLR